MNSPTPPMRIAKCIAERGICSRRQAEVLIQEGRVSVNGQKLTTPAHLVSRKDSILIDGKPLPPLEAPRIWCFYKPKGLITTHNDPQGRSTVFSFLKGKYPSLPHVISVGRLDLNSEGLLLLTTSGSLARYMELPQTKWKRVYRVRVFGSLNDDIFTHLKKGIIKNKILYKALDARFETPTSRKTFESSSRNTWIEISLTTGKNREVRVLLEHFGLQVNRLIRISYGPFMLHYLKAGECKEIPFDEFASFFPKEILHA